ncbi:ComF family protein [Rubrolithibacter danxiaensis]|uniref:ComF family protein n=1 Tax=Rubrolithibacter danxiaensis TaxID=3390805 RepID=UPI003BF7AACB
MNLIYSYLEDFFSLIFPEICCACHTNLFKNEQLICTGCLYDLPYTNFHLDPENVAARQLYGRIPFLAVSACLDFRKGSKVQNLMHEFKYNSKPEIGIKLGELYGNSLKEVNAFKNADLIIPVPLHPAKFKKRGYNQSDCFAKGLSTALGIPYSTNLLQRNLNTATQTQKSRFARYENMKHVFSVKEPLQIEHKHIILVDDVLTTGATIEACALELLKASGVKLSIATIAYAN